MAVNRLRKELKEAFQTSNDKEIRLQLQDPNDLFKWEATIFGPPDTPFEGGVYKVLLRIPTDYPMVPPTAQFLTKIFHPNISFPQGEVCLDILKSKWTPAWTISSVCRAILTLLGDPEADSPFNVDAGNLIRVKDLKAYYSMARFYAITEAGAPPLSW